MTPSHHPTRKDPPPAIVGIDGSPGAVHALAWAHDKGDVLGPVVPVGVVPLPSRAESAARLGRDAERAAVRLATQAHLTEAVDDTDPELLERARILEGHPGAALCEASAHAALLVVGTRDRSTATAGLLGSVSSYCAKHSPVPVVIVPEHAPSDRPLRTVVVGVDGSPHGDRALRWAIDHVDADGRVCAVGAFPSPSPSLIDSEPGPSIEVLEKAIRRRVEDSVARVTGYPYQGPAIEIHGVAQDARTALRDLAGSEADLLVVGARGVGDIPFLVLGSVSGALSHHPRVPTVVFHGNERL